uniref:Uncharacterized protein n=1 Tax=Triticum urartu TaxID=4572 RepID=A0A8R7QY88_TRIUA
MGVHLLPLLSSQILSGSPLARIPILLVLFCLDALRRAFIYSLCSGVRLSCLALSRFRHC